MVCYGYLRVSTEKQSIEGCKSAILNFCNDKKIGPVTWIEEIVSGRRDWKKRILGREFEKMKENDIIVMNEFSRIGRNFFESLSFIADCRRKNIKVYSVIGDIPEDDDSLSVLLLSLSAYKSMCERDLLVKRTIQGIAYAKSKGIILGRKKDKMILDNNLEENKKKIKDMIDKGIKLKYICTEFKVCGRTLKKFMNKNNIHKVPT